MTPPARLRAVDAPVARTRDSLIRELLDVVRRRAREAGDHLAQSSLDARATTPFASDVLDAERRIEAAVLEADPEEFPLRRLVERFELSSSEQLVLWTLLAQELCPIVRQMLRGLNVEPSSDPTGDVIRRIVYGQDCSTRVWNELGERGTLRRYALIERVDSGTEIPEHRRTWRIAPRVLALAYGTCELAADATRFGVLDDGRSVENTLSATGSAQVERALRLSGFSLLVGPPAHGKQRSLCAIARAAGKRVLFVDCRALARAAEGARIQLEIISREARLLDAVPVLRDLDALDAGEGTDDRLGLIETELVGAVLATSSRHIARRWSRVPTVVTVPRATATEQARLWGTAIPDAPADDRVQLARIYPLAPSVIGAVGRAAYALAGDELITLEHIAAGARTVLDERLAGLATRIESSQTQSDLVIPDDQLHSLNELIARIDARNTVYETWGFGEKLAKGLGVTALFSGPPGTGKSLAAFVIAKVLDTAVFQVDISKISSKWIGETEKNLAMLFDAAEASNAMLLFDEADSLFGKRTEVKTSNDRHANQQTNYLLQRLESYAGICILTTNHESAIDEAFKRRLSIHVRFPMPEEEERARLWRTLIPSAAPLDPDVDFEKLARTFVMSGGYIRNAVLRAAFVAASDQGSINMSRLFNAGRLEYEALGKVVSTLQLRNHTGSTL